MKIETFEASFKAHAFASAGHRILCGEVCAAI
jgi:hypothetical protein